MRMKSKKIYFFAILFSVLFILGGNQFATYNAKNITVQNVDSELDEQAFANVTKIDSVSPNPDDSTTNIVKFTAVITSGKYKNHTVQAAQ